MLKQTRTRDLEYFLELGGFGPTAVKDLPMRVVIPAFVISELQTAFQMGFLLFLPFLVIDFLVASDPDVARHDDDAAQRRLPAVQAAAVRPGGRLAPDRPVPRPELRRLSRPPPMNPEVAIDVFKTTLVFALYMVGALPDRHAGRRPAHQPLPVGHQRAGADADLRAEAVAFAGLAVLLAPWLLRILGGVHDRDVRPDGHAGTLMVRP